MADLELYFHDALGTCIGVHRVLGPYWHVFQHFLVYAFLDVRFLHKQFRKTADDKLVTSLH